MTPPDSDASKNSAHVPRSTILLERLNAIFAADPVRNVRGRSRPTQRYTYRSEASHNAVVALEGGNELSCALLLEHLWRNGFVRRFKFQPFQLCDLDLPEMTVPDVLVELTDGHVFVLEIKSAKFLTKEKYDKFETTCALLRSRGLPHLLWTDADVLGRRLWHNVRYLQRGSRLPCAEELKTKLAEVGSMSKTFGQLIAATNSSIDTLLAAAARGFFHINLSEVLHENATVSPHAPLQQWRRFFAQRNDTLGWFRRLSDRLP